MKFTKKLLFLSIAGLLSLAGCQKSETPSGDPKGEDPAGIPEGGGDSDPSGGGSGGDLNPPTPEESKAIAQYIKNMSFTDVDPAEDILGGGSGATESRLSRSRKTDATVYATDRLGGTCVEEEAYYSWKNMAGMKSDVATNVVEQCKSFSGSMFEMVEMFKSYLPDDATFGQLMHVVANMQISATEWMDIPLDFYLSGTVEDYTFYFGVVLPEMGVNEHDSFRFIKESDGTYSYEYHAAATHSRYDYMPLCLHNKRGDQDFIHYDEENQRWNMHERMDENFFVRQVGTGIHLPFVLEAGSEAYASLSEDKTVVNLTTGELVDYYFYENTDGHLHLDIHPTDNSDDVGNTQRLVPVIGTMSARWWPGHFYERVTVYDVPVYATGRASNSFFKAEKNDNGKWVVYSKSSFDNDVISIQTDAGWLLIRELHRDEDGSFLPINGICIASDEAYDICELSLSESEYRRQFINLSAFSGWDEIRAYDKDNVHTACRLTINGVETGAYYESESGSIYNNGTLVFEGGDPYGLEDAVRVGGNWSYEVNRDLNDGDYSNREVYHAELVLYKSVAETISYMESLGLECKYGSLSEKVDAALDFVSNAGTYVGGVFLYGLSGKVARQAWYELALSLFAKFDVSEKMNTIFGLE